MAVFNPPIYIKPVHPKGDVIVFGNPPELELADAANGIARFGGAWRSPSYFQAYLRAADVLVSHGAATDTLDDIGLPTFYMQRHALELLIKRFLSWVYEYAEAIGNKAVPTNNQRKRFKNSHCISKLLEDLRNTCRYYGFSEPPEELGALVKEVESFEASETWARYESSESKNHGVLHHLKDEAVVPLVALQKKLEAVASNSAFRFDGTEAYENELYYAWSDATDTTERDG